MKLLSDRRVLGTTLVREQRTSRPRSAPSWTALSTCTPPCSRHPKRSHY